MVFANGYLKKKLGVPIVDASSRAACGDLAYTTTAIAGRVIDQVAWKKLVAVIRKVYPEFVESAVPSRTLGEPPRLQRSIPA